MAYKKVIKRRAFKKKRGLLGALGLGDDPSGWNIKCSRVADSADGTSRECIDAAGNVIESVPKSSSSGSGSTWDSILKALTQTSIYGATPAPVYPYPAPQTGISTTTVLLIGGALIGVILLTRD